MVNFLNVEINVSFFYKPYLSVCLSESPTNRATSK